ncbi:MAG: lamin tail domain-containing protein [Myxococcales bacterium]|nr:lamin tail domain-containing protein [Myxococcales bacterium]
MPTAPYRPFCLVAASLVAAFGCASPTGSNGYYYGIDANVSARFDEDAGPLDTAGGGVSDGIASQDSTSDSGAARGENDTKVPVDTGVLLDSGSPDTGSPDAGPVDTGTPDTGTPDTGTPDVDSTDTTPQQDTQPPQDAGGNGPVALTPGALAITEFHPDPAKVTDAKGEWFEVYNTTNQTVHLGGLTIADEKSSHAVVGGESLTIAPKSYFVFSNQASPSVNGGITPGYAYKVVTLNNSGDLIALKVGTQTIDAVTYGGSGWVAKVPGKAYQLAPTLLNASSNDFGTAWCLAQVTYGAGDFGTPGSANSFCP